MFAQQSPKAYRDRLRLRNHAIGTERRRNLSKIILEQGTPTPLPVGYEDIDKEFFNWVDKKLDVDYNGQKLPTYKLFSNQKISEYSQTWSNLDETGNIIMNFKTITRENNPQHGESQGGSYNIPGHRDYPMFYVPVLQENGEEAYDLYSMKQPLSVNFLYTVSVVCNKYEILNKFNELMHYEFSALECYISPNGHNMPMVIENITDESEYNIDDRKYYSQSYQIKLMAYIIRKEDFKVTKVPSRFKVGLLDNDKRRKYKKVKKDDCWLGRLENSAQLKNVDGKIDDTQLPDNNIRKGIDVCENEINIVDVHSKRPSVILEEIINPCLPEEKDPYVEKIMKLFIDFPYCEEKSITFTMDAVIDIDSIETENIKDFTFKINGEIQTFEDEVKININDEVEISIIREDEYKGSHMSIFGTDPTVIFDSRIEYESALDEPIMEEEIYINKKKEGAE